MWCLNGRGNGNGSVLSLGDTVFVMPADTPEFGYFVRTLLAEDTVRIFGYNTKELHRLAQKQGVRCGNICGDLQLSAYLLRPSDTKYNLAQLALEYNVPVPASQNSLDQEEPAVALAVILPELFAKTDALIDDAGQRKLLTGNRTAPGRCAGAHGVRRI